MTKKTKKRWGKIVLSVGAIAAFTAPTIAQAATFPENVPDVNHSTLDTAVNNAKKNGVNVVKDADQTKTVTPGQVATNQKNIAADYSNMKNNLDKQSKDYHAKKIAYDKAYADYRQKTDHPTYYNSPWSHGQIDKLLGNNATQVTPVTPSGKLSRKMLSNDRAINPNSLPRFTKVSYNNTRKNDHNNITVYKLRNNMNWRYYNAFRSNPDGQWLDVDFHIYNVGPQHKEWNKGEASYISVDNDIMGTAILGNVDYVSYRVTFYKHGTNQRYNINPLIGYGDIDYYQYVNMHNSPRDLGGPSLYRDNPKNDRSKVEYGVRSGIDVAPSNRNYQAWYAFSKISQFTYSFGSRHKINQNVTYHEVGNIAFARTIPPVKPEAPAVPTVHYHYTHLKSNEKIDAPVKTVFNNLNPQSNVDGKIINAGQTINYKLSQQFGTLGSDIGNPYKSVRMTDVLPANISLAGNTADAIKLLDAKGNVVANGDSYLTKNYNSKTRQVVVDFKSNFLNDKARYGKNWKILIKAKVAHNSSLKDGTEFVNQGHYVINGHDQPSNKVTNKYRFHPEVPNPSKSVNETGNPTGKTQVWTVKQQVSQMDVTTGEKYASFTMSDTLDNRLSYVSARVLDGNNKDVTKTAGTLSRSGQKVTFAFNKNYLQKMPMHSEFYKLQIITKVSPHQTTATIYNSAVTNINGMNKNTAPAKVVVPPTNTNITKSITSAKNKNGNGVAYADKDATVGYALNAHFGNTVGLNSVSITDNLEKVLHPDFKSVKIMGTIADENGKSHQVDLTNKFTNKSSGQNLNLVLNDALYKSLLINSNVKVMFNAKVLGHTDFSDYVHGNQLLVPNKGHVVVNNKNYDSNIVNVEPPKVNPGITKYVKVGSNGYSSTGTKAKYDQTINYLLRVNLGNSEKLKDGFDVSDAVSNATSLKDVKDGSYTVNVTDNGKNVGTNSKLTKTGNKLVWHVANAQQYVGHSVDFKFTGTISADVAKMKPYLNDNLQVPNNANFNNHVDQPMNSNTVKVKMPNIYTFTGLASDFLTGDKLTGKTRFNLEGTLVAKDRENIVPSNGVDVYLSNLDNKNLSLPAVKQGENKVVSHDVKDITMPSGNSMTLNVKDHADNYDVKVLLQPGNFKSTSETYKTGYNKPTKKTFKQNERQLPVEETLYYYDVTNKGVRQTKRELRESVELTQQKSLSAKAGYGIVDTSVLNIGGWHLNTDQSKFAGLYDMNFKSDDSDKERIFMTNSYIAGHTVRKAERLDFTSQSSPTVFSTPKKDVDQYQTMNKSDQTFADQREKQLNLMPKWNSTQVKYRFNQRDLRNGYQSYNMKANHNKSQNTNNDDEITKDAPHVKVTNGGYRNYISNFVPTGDYEMDYNMLKPLGANKLNFKTVRSLNIYGHRYLSKQNGFNSENDEIGLQPTISGDNQQDLDGFTAKDKQWLKDNNVKGVKP